MSSIRSERLTAQHDGLLVVFIIGMRVNHVHKLHKWLPVARAMGPMIAELSRDPDSGFMGTEYLLRGARTLLLLQYWRDFDSLERYARATDRAHRPAWAAFNRAVGTDGSVGIFHETFVVQPGAHESVYVNMPPFGLGKAARLVPATGTRSEARGRMGGPGDSEMG